MQPGNFVFSEEACVRVDCQPRFIFNFSVATLQESKSSRPVGAGSVGECARELNDLHPPSSDDEGSWERKK